MAGVPRWPRPNVVEDPVTVISRIAEALRRIRRMGPVGTRRFAARILRGYSEPWMAPRQYRRLRGAALARRLGAGDLNTAWRHVADAPSPFVTNPPAKPALERLGDDERARVLAAAEMAHERRVDLLGSGPVQLATPIDWHVDFKSGHRWPLVAPRRLDLRGFGLPSDVKVPWELSRLQWLLPAGQAYLLDGDDRHAVLVRDIIIEWDEANPPARGVNWACAMDVALRALSLLWFCRVFHAATAWQDGAFRERALRLLVIHGDFVSRHLEWSDVGGNHLATDLAALVVLGHGLAETPETRRWRDTGWRHLKAEIMCQVGPDGANFEASTGYHRLVMELFVMAAAARRGTGETIEPDYAGRLGGMARFAAAYTRPDGTAPLWGDADDGRALPLGGQAKNDHRYLPALAAHVLDDDELRATGGGPHTESFWWFGDRAAGAASTSDGAANRSRHFGAAGVYIMRGAGDHVFIDAGPVGMAGRGGHGHNDCLGLEACLAGTPLLTDCGAYVYTADAEARNRFRATASHNTPMVDGAEINRLVDPAMLFTLHDDATPEVRRWSTSDERDILVAAHSGYHRLAQPVTPLRRVVLDKRRHALLIHDQFEGTGVHAVRIPFHLAPGIAAHQTEAGRLLLKASGGDFHFVHTAPGDWTLTLEDGWQSPSYGIRQPITVVVLSRHGALAPLTVALAPSAASPAALHRWITKELDERDQD